jgi:zinc transporter ZupT
MTAYVSVWPVLALALLHFFGSRLSFLSSVPRSIWLSVAGGVSVSYIFLHLFPELQEGQEQIAQAFGAYDFLQHHIYLLALIGLVVFYGLERAVVSSKEEQPGKPEREHGIDNGVFWLHIGSFAIYNALIGYSLFQREEGPLREIILFSVAMALHFVVNDIGLQEHHQEKYQRRGRWVLVVALLLGWGTGYIFNPPEAIVLMILAFIGGGVILNVLKEELPEERKSRYWAFLLGAGAYAVLLLAL